MTSNLLLTGLFSLTERRVNDHKLQPKWVICPTCRQHTDFGNIAYADDRQNESCSSSVRHTNQSHEKHEASMIVHGSYGTKVCNLLNALSQHNWHG